MVRASGDMYFLYTHISCGLTNDTAYDVLFEPNGEVHQLLNVSLAARWCSLGVTDGGRGVTPATIRASAGDVQRLGKDTVTDPKAEEGQWSCTVSSLGHGPVFWKLQAPDFLSDTTWFNHYASDVSDDPVTAIQLTLNSSVFWNRPGGGGPLGVGVSDSQGDGASATPWLKAWDPTHVYRSAAWDKAGWSVYNFVDWAMRLDLTQKYLELNHSWYCDDMNVSTP